MLTAKTGQNVQTFLQRNDKIFILHALTSIKY